MKLIKKLFIIVVLLKATVSFSSQSYSNLSCPSETLLSLDAKYLFIGENHFDPNIPTFFKTVLPILKQKGFSVFFTEHIDSQDQNLVDEIDESTSHTHLYENFYDPLKYQEITNIILKNNYKLIAMDRRKDIRHHFPDGRKLALRDEHMFYTAFDYIRKNPNDKIIFFNGSSHSYNFNNPFGPSFYDLFTKYFGKENTINIKIDYYNGRVVSKERSTIKRLNGDFINLNCQSGVYFYTPLFTTHFNFYGFKDNQEVFPTIDSNGILL